MTPSVEVEQLPAGDQCSQHAGGERTLSTHTPAGGLTRFEPQADDLRVEESEPPVAPCSVHRGGGQPDDARETWTDGNGRVRPMLPSNLPRP